MVVEYLPHQPKIKGLSLVTTYETRTQFLMMIKQGWGSMVVEPLPNQPKGKDSSPATTADTRRTHSFYKNELRGGNMVVQHLPHQHKIKGLSLVTTSDARTQFFNNN
jgi:hypothetical protein